MTKQPERQEPTTRFASAESDSPANHSQSQEGAKQAATTHTGVVTTTSSPSTVAPFRNPSLTQSLFTTNSSGPDVTMTIRPAPKPPGGGEGTDSMTSHSILYGSRNVTAGNFQHVVCEHPRNHPRDCFQTLVARPEFAQLSPEELRLIDCHGFTASTYPTKPISAASAPTSSCSPFSVSSTIAAQPNITGGFGSFAGPPYHLRPSNQTTSTSGAVPPVTTSQQGYRQTSSLFGQNTCSQNGSSGFGQTSPPNRPIDNLLSGCSKTPISGLNQGYPNTGEGIFGHSQGLATGGGAYGHTQGINTGDGLFGSGRGPNTYRGLFSDAQAPNTGDGLFGSGRGPNTLSGLFGDAQAPSTGDGLFGSGRGPNTHRGLFGAAQAPYTAGLFGRTQETTTASGPVQRDNNLPSTNTTSNRCRSIFGCKTAIPRNVGKPGLTAMIAFSVHDAKATTDVEYFVHKHLLRPWPGFNDLKFKDNSSESMTYMETILDVNLDTFSIFVDWLYTGQLQSYKKQATKLNAISVKELIDLYLFAAQRNVPTLRDDIMSNLVSRYNQDHELTTSDQVALVFQELDSQNPLCRFVADTWGAKGRPIDIESISTTKDVLTPGLFEFMKLAWSAAIKSRLSGPSGLFGHTPHPVLPICGYHEHNYSFLEESDSRASDN